MSGTFKGFTQNDIEKMKNGNEDDSSNKIKEKPRIKKPITVTKPQSIPVENFEPISEDAKLFKPITVVDSNNLFEIELTSEASSDSTNEVPQNSMTDETEKNNDINANRKHSFDDNTLSKFADDILKFEKPINMAEFQIQQKLIEEQNRKRKEMLSKALEDREKQTAEETIRLEKIKKELQTLDAQLSGDVSILRKQIDKSCLAYSEAEKSYHKIEMEFLAAKMNLQKLKERKEMLTEHLCTLIAHNEARKAKKLEFLMDQLAYNTSESPQPPSVCDGVCEQTGKMLEMEDGQVIIRD